ncbi:spore germination protein [Bacillus zhangzhouensis]|uniref:Spore gernimation protein GerA n=1 Tax=Bacillus zhangzhouensis TaxID=1178540 RepID=A0A081L9K0_9BACI|nr:spore germination protein [Bacillus zhangzhouensis]KEP25926.1 spore gernimation protein GerA [Bacillus zhangzhouensis]
MLKKNKQHQKDPNSVFEALSRSADFTNELSHIEDLYYRISFFRSLINGNLLHEQILPCIKQRSALQTLEELRELIPIEQAVITSEHQKISNSLQRGYIAIRFSSDWSKALLLPIEEKKGRPVGPPELEFGIISAQEAFVEVLDTNLNLIRRRLPTPDLRVVEKTVGSLSQTKVAILYIDQVANPDNVETVIQRIEDVNYDQILDANYLVQMLYDVSNTIFPLFLNTERPDRVSSGLTEGKIAIMVDGSPHSLLAPTILLEYFSTMEDYNMSWIAASCFRLLRMFAVIFSIFATPLYVAVLTFHYELIPTDLLETIVASRYLVPFPPIIEALFLEISIELLREAGSRLPTKVGQTLGIVGGIVIGQAAVAAGLTSNILLIIVALSALASFVTPIYKMGSAIRLLRFPFLFAAQIWGALGISLMASFLITHLMKLTSIGQPYLEPIYPLRLADLKDSFIRPQLRFLKNRPKNLRGQNETIHRQKPKQGRKGKNDFYE